LCVTVVTYIEAGIRVWTLLWEKFPDWPPGVRTAYGTSFLPLGAVVSLFCESV